MTFFPTTISNGNMIIDKSTLEKLKLDTEEKYICFSNNNELVIKKQKDICIFCGKDENLNTVSEASICSKCKEELKTYSKS
jgi:hypothetical protein